MSAPDRSGDRERDRFRALLEQARAQSATIAFWWRDDDARTVTPALERLLALAHRHNLPLALAVIPQGATGSLADRLAAEPDVAVLQHGWRHANHSPEGVKKMELGDHRPPDAMLDELKAGYERLTGLFPAQFVPILVPPWNRIGDAVRTHRRAARLSGLSMFGHAPPDEPHWVNTHLDIIDWTTRGPVPPATAYAILCREVERRLDSPPEPIGILTHHLVHKPETWRFLEVLLEEIGPHPAISWPPARELFGLPGKNAQEREAPEGPLPRNPDVSGLLVNSAEVGNTRL